MDLLLPGLPASLTHAEAEAYVQRCVHTLKQDADRAAGVCTIDASGLESFDSAALAALLSVRRAVILRGGALRLGGTPPRLRELADLYGVSELLAA